MFAEVAIAPPCINSDLLKAAVLCAKRAPRELTLSRLTANTKSRGSEEISKEQSRSMKAIANRYFGVEQLFVFFAAISSLVVGTLTMIHAKSKIGTTSGGYKLEQTRADLSRWVTKKQKLLRLKKLQ